MSAEPMQWHSLEPLLTRDGPFAPPNFEKGAENMEILQQDKRVLVVGAGGLGCEILKNLALSGFRDIHVIDLDTIDVSNLNRQFLFRRKDVGKSKAEVAAQFIMKRCPNVSVKHYVKKIQEFPLSWYKKFDVVIAGLDNVEARRWLNQTLNSLVQFDDDHTPDISTVIPFIDGGTEGFKGQARVFLPKLTTCFECSLDSMPQQNVFNSCTIASTPRIPEHCIVFAKEIMFQMLEDFKSCDDYKLYEKKSDDDEYMPNKEYHRIPLDKDNPNHMTWIFNRASERAKKFNINGVTYKLTQQVVKNIIPAIASTNAAISAACVNEAVKIVTHSSYLLDNFMQFNGVNLKGCMLHQYVKKPDCQVCCMPNFVHINPKSTLGQLRAQLEKDSQYEEPSVFLGDKILYLRAQHETWQAELAKPVSELFKSKDTIRISDTKKKNGFAIVIFDDSV